MTKLKKLKIRVVLPDNTQGHLARVGCQAGPDGQKTMVYRLTHHVRPTREILGEAELEAALAATDKHGETNIHLVATDYSVLLLARDTRHGTAGWRCCRYFDRKWDESYLFFETLHKAFELAANPEHKHLRESAAQF